MTFRIFYKYRCALVIGATACTLAFVGKATWAADAVTHSESFAVPVFERVDLNGVDLVTGLLRVTSPTYVAGTDDARIVNGLQWTGKAWTHIDRPAIWWDSAKKSYIVNYLGGSQEFHDYNKNFAEKKPITGSKLNCSIFQPGGLTAFCIYTHRGGDTVYFKGVPTPFSSTIPAYGQSALLNGNMGVYVIIQNSVDNRNRTWGVEPFDGGAVERDYDKVNKSLGIFTINTPNNNSKKHYLQPQDTIQTFTDSVGTQWKYTINRYREITKIDLPSNSADITIEYAYDRVISVTNPNGTWNYAYSSTSNNIRTTTVTDPLGGITKVKYNTEKSYVLENIDPLNRVTKYEYDAGDRLWKIVYPEQNYVTFSHDARGNILFKTEHPKPGSGLAPITQSALYPTTCTNTITCNRPISVTDPLLGTTTFEYALPTQGTYNVGSLGLVGITYDIGTGKPTKVTSPESSPGAPRPQVRNQYTSGMLVRSAYCRTLAVCADTTDEVVTTYDYGGTEATTRILHGVAVTSDGVTLTTCYAYDELGRRVSETPPRADITTCPKVIAPYSPGHAPAIAPYSPAPVFPTP